MEKEISLAIKMPMSKFKELKKEVSIKTLLSQLDPSINISMIDKMVIAYIIAVEKGEKSIKFKELKGGETR